MSIGEVLFQEGHDLAYSDFVLFGLVGLDVVGIDVPDLDGFGVQHAGMEAVVGYIALVIPLRMGKTGLGENCSDVLDQLAYGVIRLAGSFIIHGRSNVGRIT